MVGLTLEPRKWTAQFRCQVEEHLFPSESLLAWCVTDLDEHLCFADTLLVLTDRRLLVAPLGSHRVDMAHRIGHLSFQGHVLADVDEMVTREYSGTGTLEVRTHEGVCGAWHYTARQSSAVRNLVGSFECGKGDSTLAETSEEDAVSVPPRAAIGTLFRLTRFSRRYAVAITVGFVLALATTVAGLIPPYLTMPLLDDVLIPYQQRTEHVARNGVGDGAVEVAAPAATELEGSTVAWYLAGLGGAAIAGWLLEWAKGIVMARASEGISANLRNEAFAHLQRLSLDFFSGRRTGDLISRISSDTDRICSFLSDNVVDFGTDVLMIVGTSVVLLSIDPVLALATLVPFPLIAWLVYRVRERLTVGFSRGGRAWSEMTNVLTDAIPGIRVVKAFAQEPHEVARFRRANDRVVNVNNRVNTVWASFWPLVVLLNQLGLLLVWAVGTWRVFDHRITVGVLTAFIAYIGRFYMRLESMTRMVSSTERAATSAHRLFDILDRMPGVPEPVQPRHPGRLDAASIQFQGVTFQYGNRTVLEGINLEIQPGEMIGLVGPSGAGKSTLANLVCRFYDPTAGAVLVGNVDLRMFPVNEYRRNIGLVLQEPFLFYGTVADNIAYGRPHASRQEVVSAARTARAHEFILRLPDGYDTVVGERGQNLSGGERQRVSIARALLVDPAILILDEATSSVDTETELEIQEALENLIQGRTTIAIAHRLSTLRRADRLVVLEKGKVAEVGDHQELLNHAGVYARLHRAQYPVTADH
ncbi:MAG: cyanophycin metabolism-associated ABC transporter [Pirellulaceae bacterium]